MKMLLTLLLFTSLWGSEHPFPQIIYTTSRHINVITPDEVNKVFAVVTATVVPDANLMKINLKLYLNDLLIGEQNNEVSW
jgi:hypothetical protein